MVNLTEAELSIVVWVKGQFKLGDGRRRPRTSRRGWAADGGGMMADGPAAREFRIVNSELRDCRITEL